MAPRSHQHIPDDSESPRSPSRPERRGRFALRGESHSTSLRSKLVLSLALMLAVFTMIDEFVRQSVIVPEFVNLERVSAIKDTTRVVSAINVEIDFLAETARQDRDVLTYLTEREGERRVHEHRLPRRERVDYAGVFAGGDDWHWMSTSEGEPAEPPAQLIEVLHNSFVSSERTPDRGVVGSEGTFYLFASIAFPGVDEDARYLLVRSFDQRLVGSLQQRTSVPFSLGFVEHPKRGIHIDDRSEFELLVNAPLSSVGGNHCELRIQTPREVMMRSSVTNGFARYLSLCGSCASLLLLLLLLQWIVIGRLEAIREHSDRIAQTGILADASTPVPHRAGRDEIGQLAQAFDRMKGRLVDAQRQMSDSSHAAGMSLVADTVIHNVGNVLTNVNSLLETATHRVEGLRIQPLNKLAERLNRDEIDEAFQRAIPAYLLRLSESLGSDRDELALLLETLDANVQHIHQVIRDQKRHAHQQPQRVDVTIRPLVREAVSCCQARLNQDQIQVELSGPPQAMASTDQLLLLQIMINLIGNARNAMRGTKQRSKLRIEWIVGQRGLEIHIQDNGCGMDAPTLERVFDAHFTTRETGSGLGLHFCANALRRIGGSIRALSDGPNLGATFVITLPLTSTSEADHPSPAPARTSSSAPSNAETAAHGRH
ncbi:MAG: ATP-binding protein [Planctomycetota bacterium]